MTIHHEELHLVDLIGGPVPHPDVPESDCEFTALHATEPGVAALQPDH